MAEMSPSDEHAGRISGEKWLCRCRMLYYVGYCCITLFNTNNALSSTFTSTELRRSRESGVEKHRRETRVLRKDISIFFTETTNEKMPCFRRSSETLAVTNTKLAALAGQFDAPFGRSPKTVCHSSLRSPTNSVLPSVAQRKVQLAALASQVGAPFGR